ncbi:hypothetical protein PMAYCL1PPCAC_11448, partial [Pristionchus mayeri]
MSSEHRRDGDEDNIDENECVTFSLGVVDLFTSRVFVIDEVGDFYAFGKLIGLYAIDVRTLIIIDYHKHTRLLKQRVIYVDLHAK